MWAFLAEGERVCVPHVLAVFFFVLHWKRGRVGASTPRRAQIVVSTITGMTGLGIRFKSILTQLETTLEVSLLHPGSPWFGGLVTLLWGLNRSRSLNTW